MRIPLVVFTVLFKENDIRNMLSTCYHLNESYRAVLSCDAFILLYKVVLSFESMDKILKCDNSNETEQYFPMVLFVIRHNVVLIFTSADKLLKCDLQCC